MINHKTMLGASSGLLALGLALGSGAAAAQTTAAGPHGHGRGHGAPLKGIVQSVGQGNFQLSANGTLTTVTFTTSTRVVRMVSGSTADLTKGAHVDLQLISGGNTVKAVIIAPTWTKGPGNTKAANGGTHTWTGHGHHGDHTGRPDMGTPKSKLGAPKFGATKHTHPLKSARTHADGQVVSFNASTGALTLQGHGGQTTTYTVSASVTVTKFVAGSTSDIHPNETVQVFAPAGGAANLIIILSA